jgi:hypothetical protein
MGQINAPGDGDNAFASKADIPSLMARVASWWRDDVMPPAIGRLSAPATIKSRHRDEAVTASFSLVTRETSLYRRTPTRLTPPFALPPAL